MEQVLTPIINLLIKPLITAKLDYKYMKYLPLKMGLLGIITGLLSYASAIYAADYFGMYFGPGTVYSIILLIFLYLHGIHENILKEIIFVLWSAVSYLVAVLLAISLMGLLNFVSFMIAGFVGGICLLSGFSLLIKKMQMDEVLIIALVAGLLGLSWFLGAILSGYRDGYGDAGYGFITLYIIWQAGVSYLLGMSISSNKK